MRHPSVFLLLIACADAPSLQIHHEESPSFLGGSADTAVVLETHRNDDTAMADVDADRYIGGDLLVPDAAQLTLHGEWTYGWVGDEALLGDVDGDQLADLVVTSPSLLPFGGIDDGNGVIYVTSGLASGTYPITQAASTIINSESEYSIEHVSAGRDIDGDGLNDLVVSCVGRANAPHEGAIFILRAPLPGGLVDLESTAEIALYGGIKPSLGIGTPFLGGFVEIVPDTNGDGRDDLLVQVYESFDVPWQDCDYAEPEPGCGNEIWLVHTPTQTGAPEPASLIFPPPGADGLDTSDGDLDGDGASDLVLGFYLDPARAPEAGSVRVVYGPIGDTVELAGVDTRLGAGQQDHLGASVGVGDIDGDGYDDVFAGAPETTFFTPFDSGSGRAYVTPGPIYGEERVDLDAVATLLGSDDNTYFGLDVEVADIDQDGFADVALTNHLLAPLPTTYISYGPLSGTLSMASQADATIQGAGTGLDIADADGDGYPDVLLGAVGDDTLAVDGGAAFLLLGGP